ncbi:hypothetical protein ACFU6I_33405 [Streptomyces sp. NPDC057486]|uniref:hypothetical protein n=1 Tax=Streptomyces sp. NPDC057486 TaxID=3346145 RepID=UPI00368F592D
MSTTISIPLADMHHIRHLPITTVNSQGEVARTLEIYTGWVQCNLTGEPDPVHYSAKTYIPTGKNAVTRWPDDPPNDEVDWMANWTATVAPSAIDLPEDQTITAVDGATVALEAQSFGGVKGAPRFLVLTAEVGLQRGRVLSYTYQVNVLSFSGTPVLDALDFGSSSSPHVP